MMDIFMPKMNGNVATRAIRDTEAQKNYDRTLIFGMSSDMNEEDRKESMQSGMDNALKKPITKKFAEKIRARIIENIK